MSDAHLPEEPKLSEDSWRPKYYGLVKEGHKLRVSSLALKLAMLVMGLMVLGSQVLMSWSERSTDRPSYIKSPRMTMSQESPYVPSVTNSKKELELERRNAQAAALGKMGPVRIERIKPIRLTQVKEIPSGAEVMAYLSSGASNGMVKVVLSENLKYDGDLILKKGTTLIGKGSSSDDRLYIEFHKAIGQDKSSMKVKAYAFDKGDRIMGLKGKKISNYAFKLATSAGLIFLGGVADGMREDQSSNPFMQNKPTKRDAALNGVSTATLETGKDMMADLKSQEARVEVASSTPVLIIFGETETND